MAETDSERQADAARITLTPDMRPVADKDGVPPVPPTPPEPPRVRTRRLPYVLGVAGIVFGLAGAGIAGWTYMEGQREILRLSTELAQVRLGIELYRQTAAAAQENKAPDLSGIEQRLAALEAVKPATNQVSLPDISAPTTAAPASSTAGNDGDCLPTGTRLMVAQGDSYPVCGQNVTVTVGAVNNGYIELSDGTAVPSGGTVPLKGTACRIGVTSAGDEATTGYAEIRVSC